MCSEDDLILNRKVTRSMGLNSFQLKWIAIATMLIDHVGAVLFPYEMGFRIIGRISFPIFCFLLAEGFFHTKDVKRYMLRLFIFALISEVPYDLAFRGEIWYQERQNVFFTLFLGVFLLYLMKMSSGFLLKFGEAFFVMYMAEFLCTDYGGRGILLILIYYVLREKKGINVCAGAAWNLLYGWRMIQNYGMLAAPFLALYNGKRGPKLKYFFYVFYPAHLLVLYYLKGVLRQAVK